MKKKKITPYKVISLIILCVVAFTFEIGRASCR